jgi:hypothetical protein
MSGANQYATLMTSLPYHPSLFAAKQTPLSRIRLRQRLQLMLTPEDAQQLELAANVLEWHRQPAEDSDSDIVKRAQGLVRQLDRPFLQDIVRERLDMRTLVTAMRRRHAGAAAPGERELWGYGRWVNHIRRNWGDPVFRLERVFRWGQEANRLLQQGDSLGLERLLLDTAWTDLNRHALGHYFDFAAVVIYSMRWSLIARWTGYDAEAAALRFDTLITGALQTQTEQLFH